jgi:hypothetical protein
MADRGCGVKERRRSLRRDAPGPEGDVSPQWRNLARTVPPRDWHGGIAPCPVRYEKNLVAEKDAV